MVNFSRKTAKLFQIVLGTILGFLGFTGCSKEDLGGGEICMYGMPTSRFEAKGTVTKEKDNAPVEDATVILKVIKSDTAIPVDSVETDAIGTYSITGYNLFYKVRVVCVPSESSGLEADSVEIIPKYTGGDGSWNRGSMEYTADFKLKEKQD